MSNQEDESRFHPDTESGLHPNTEKLLVAIFITTLMTMPIVGDLVLPKLETKADIATADMEAEQIAEGERYSAVVSTIDTSKGLLVLDNGDEIPFKDLPTQLAVDDELTYIKTFDYRSSLWSGMPERLDEETLTNIKIIRHNSD